jgi:hypothetical protein
MNFLIMTDSKNARETPFRYQTGRERDLFLQKFLHRGTKPQRFLGSMKYLFFLDNLYGTKNKRVYAPYLGTSPKTVFSIVLQKF